MSSSLQFCCYDGFPLCSDSSFDKDSVLATIFHFFFFLSFISFNLMSKFFCEKEFSSIEERSIDNPLTYVICRVSEDSHDLVEKCIELQDNPLAALSFSDFSIGELIKHGINYKALNITPDMRLGHEAEFDELQAMFETNEDKIFVQPEKTE